MITVAFILWLGVESVLFLHEIGQHSRLRSLCSSLKVITTPCVSSQAQREVDEQNALIERIQQ